MKYLLIASIVMLAGCTNTWQEDFKYCSDARPRIVNGLCKQVIRTFGGIYEADAFTINEAVWNQCGGDMAIRKEALEEN